MPRRARGLLPWALGALGAAIFAWVLWRIDYAAFLAALADANIWLVALVPAAILFEQWVGAAKWKLLLATLGGARVSRVFAANMAASLAGYVVPAVGSPVVRSWLVARCEGLKFASVLASIAVDRAVDAAAFVSFAIAAVLLIGLPQSGESLRTGITAALVGSAAVLAVCVALLVAFRKSVRSGGQGVHRFVSWLPARWRERTDRIVDITPWMDTKLRAVRAYKSQCAVLRFDQAVAGLNRYRGEMHSWPGGDYAEVFVEMQQ